MVNKRDVVSNPEHTFRVIFLALLIARAEGVKSDPADWHLKANKWLKVQGAGK